MGWFAGVTPRQRRLYTIFIGIIALTLPCYCAGLGALALAPTNRPSAVVTATPKAITATPGVSTATLPPNATLGPTPTQWIPLTPTNTATGQPTATPTLTLTPSATSTATA